MAHVSVQIAHDHIATAFHFLTSKRLVPAGSGAAAAAAALALPLGSAAGAGAPEGRSTSMASAMVGDGSSYGFLGEWKVGRERERASERRWWR